CHAGCSIEAVCTALRIKVSDLFTEPRKMRAVEPPIVRDARIAVREGLSPNLPRATKEQPMTIIWTDEQNVDEAIGRALALMVEFRELAVVRPKCAQSSVWKVLGRTATRSFSTPRTRKPGTGRRFWAIPRNSPLALSFSRTALFCRLRCGPLQRTCFRSSIA